MSQELIVSNTYKLQPTMGSILESEPLNMMFLPWVASGHMIPMVEIARVFAARQKNVKVTIITTTHNALIFMKSISRDIQSGHNISLHILPFPHREVGLPEGIENYSTTTGDQGGKLFQAISLLQSPVEKLLRDQQPDCFVADMFYPWAVDLAAELNIPRITFDPTSLFAMCVMDALHRFAPHQKVASDTEVFVVPGLPDRIELTRLKLPDYVRDRLPYCYLEDQMRDSDTRSYGVLINSCYEIEPAYSDHFRKVMGRKHWCIGPVSLFLNSDDKAERGHNAVVNSHECLSWLDTKKEHSVLYISFGSMFRFTSAQLIEIALALESSGHPFIWVVRKQDEEEDKEEKWLPDGFEKRIKENKMGMIIRGWAPQVIILEHPAIGGFMTHCGWNSLQETIIAGVPVIAWPLYCEQFYHEKLVTEVWKIGVGVGAEIWHDLSEGIKVPLKKEKIEKAVIRLMGDGTEGNDARKRASELGEIAKMAVKEGGSSCNSLSELVQELLQLRGHTRNAA